MYLRVLRSSWIIWVYPKSNANALIRDTQSRGTQSCEDGGRDRRDGSANPETCVSPEVGRSKDSPLELLEKGQPCRISDFWPPELLREYIFVA